MCGVLNVGVTARADFGALQRALSRWRKVMSKILLTLDVVEFNNNIASFLGDASEIWAFYRSANSEFDGVRQTVEPVYRGLIVTAFPEFEILQETDRIIEILSRRDFLRTHWKEGKVTGHEFNKVMLVQDSKPTDVLLYVAICKLAFLYRHRKEPTLLVSKGDETSKYQADVIWTLVEIIVPDFIFHVIEV